jgi:hypothetical protein
MNVLTKADLRMLMEKSGPVCVSIYMPTKRVGREIGQNPIRLKNLLDTAEDRLAENGLSPLQVQDLLEPVHTLLWNGWFWKHQNDGLAIFISPQRFERYRLPFGFEELVVVANRFHVKPLLQLLSNDGSFYVLALSQGEIRLFQGTRYTVNEVELKDVPESLAEVLKWDDLEKRLQYHTSTQTPGGARVRPSIKSERPAIFHGHGVASADDPKDYIARYFRRVDDGVAQVLDATQAPLVLAGVDYLHAIYHQVNSYPHLVDEGIEGNPEGWSAEELHERAWRIVEPIFSASRKEATARYAQLVGAGSQQVSDDLREVLSAAHYGQVEVLFVAVGVQQWGIFDANANKIELHQEAGAGDEDLLDLAAVQTLLNGGMVYVSDAKDVPGRTVLAAIFRY